MCFSTSSCARLASDQIIGHGATEELVIVTELTTNGALGIPRGLVSTWGLVAVEAIFEPSFGAILAKRHPPDPNNLRNPNAPNSWFESGAHTFESRHLGLQCRGFQKLLHATLELQSLQMVHKADVVCALPRATVPRLCRVRADSPTNCTTSAVETDRQCEIDPITQPVCRKCNGQTRFPSHAIRLQSCPRS